MSSPRMACDTKSIGEGEDASTMLPDRILADAVPRGPKLKDWIRIPGKGTQSSAESLASDIRRTTLKSSSGVRRSKTTLSDKKSEEEDPGYSHSSTNLCYPHSCRKCYSECLNKLMNLCDTQEVMDFNQALKQSFRGTKLKKTSETVDSEAFIVTEGHKTQTPVDTVVQLYSIDTHSTSRIYYNLFACKKLSELHSGLQNRCYGFRLVRRLHFVQDALPDNFSKAYDEYSISHPRAYHPHPDMRPKDQRYILMESDYSGSSILHSRIKPSQAISIIGQVACTLAVAERELEFEHRNLHEENIMLLPSSSKNQHFIIDGRTCCVKGSGIKVTIFDDNFSRMTCNNQVIMRMRNYNCMYKEKTAIYLTMERIIKDRWDVFHPETNALWLAYLCGHLSDYLTVPNPTGDWQRKLELLALMQRDLHRFRSADEFVWKYINKIGHIHSGHEYQPHHWGNDRPGGTAFFSTIRNMLRLRGRAHNKADGPSSLGSHPVEEDSAGRPRGREA